MPTTTHPTARHFIRNALATLRSEESLRGAGVRITYLPRFVAVRGDTFALRDTLAARGFRWDRQLGQWSRRYESCATQEDARSLYGDLVRALRGGVAAKAVA